MMLICHYTDRIELEWGKPVRIVTAHPINKKYADREYDFYKELDNGNAVCRNLYSSSNCGYRIAFPGVKLGGYYGTSIAVVDAWGSLDKKIQCWPSKLLTESDKNILIWAYPDFKYVLQKWKGTRQEAMEALSIWQKHPEIELMLAAGYSNIAFNHAFWRLTEKKRKEICNWLRHNPHPEFTGYTLAEVQQRVKYNLTEEQWQEFRTWNNKHYGPAVSYELYKYLKKQEERLNPDTEKTLCHWIKETYTDYKKSFKSPYCHHDFNDDYWRFPKDLWEFHTRVNDEINTAIQEERAAREAEKAKDERNVFQRLRRVAKKYEQYNAEVDGYYIYTTGSFKDWKLQAKELHQCIVGSGYYNGMAKRKYLIVFIRKEEKPIATAQISIGEKIGTWKIGQFYADERGGPNNSRPSAEVQTAFNKWLSTVTVKEAI